MLSCCSKLPHITPTSQKCYEQSKLCHIYMRNPLQQSNLATGDIVQSAWSIVACTFKGVHRSLIKWDCVCERTLGASLLGSHIKTLLLSHLIYPKKSSSSAPILSRVAEKLQVESSFKRLFSDLPKGDVFLQTNLTFLKRTASCVRLE